jgi:hypothetical protein
MINAEIYLEQLIAVVLVICVITLMIPYDMGYALYCFWLICFFTLAAYKLLYVSWDCISRLKYNRLIQSLSCLMFDFDLSKYVDGVI